MNLCFFVCVFFKELVVLDVIFEVLIVGRKNVRKISIIVLISFYCIVDNYNILEVYSKIYLFFMICGLVRI